MNIYSKIILNIFKIHILFYQRRIILKMKLLIILLFKFNWVTIFFSFFLFSIPLSMITILKEKEVPPINHSTCISFKRKHPMQIIMIELYVTTLLSQ